MNKAYEELKDNGTIGWVIRDEFGCKKDCTQMTKQEYAEIKAKYICPTAMLVDCPKAPTCAPGMKPEKCTVSKPKETTMRMCNFDDEGFSPEANSLSYLGERSHAVYYTKRQDLQRKFGLLDDEPPENAREFLERIASGKYVIDKDKLDKSNYGDYTRFIEWRDPTKTKDQVGYDAAEKKLTAAKTKAEDTLTLFTSDPAKQLAALQEFEAVTIQ